MAKLGEKAPVFSLVNQDNKKVNLEDYLGQKPIVLYFYPKNFTPGCTAQACSFRDTHEEFKTLGAIVLGVSNDTVKSHARFAKKYKLPFTVLSDQKGKVKKLYKIKPDFLGLLPGRETIVINKEGIIVHRFDSIQATKHIPQALKALKSN